MNEQIKKIIADVKDGRDITGREVGDLVEEIERLQDHVEYETDPSAYNLRRGHDRECEKVAHPKSPYECNCVTVIAERM